MYPYGHMDINIFGRSIRTSRTFLSHTSGTSTDDMRLFSAGMDGIEKPHFEQTRSPPCSLALFYYSPHSNLGSIVNFFASSHLNIFRHINLSGNGFFPDKKIGCVLQQERLKKYLKISAKTPA